jgi:hypothetical protein
VGDPKETLQHAIADKLLFQLAPSRTPEPLDESRLTPGVPLEDAGCLLQRGDLRPIDLVDALGQVLDLLGQTSERRGGLLEPLGDLCFVLTTRTSRKIHHFHLVTRFINASRACPPW